MTCEDCGKKMRCGYSVPVGKRLRYRAWRCECGKRLESVEMPVDLLGQEVEAIRKRIREGQERRFHALSFAMRKKGGG